MSQDIEMKANKLKMLLLDVDGVLTEGGIILGNDGFEAKKFDVQDGMGITLAQKVGIEVGIITGRVSEAVERRAEELKIEHLFQGHFWKIEALREIITEFELGLDQLGYVGDDVLDVPIMKEVGLPMAPGSARPEVKAHAVITADARGGNGAIRELVDRLLALRGEKEEIYRFYEESGNATSYAD